MLSSPAHCASHAAAFFTLFLLATAHAAPTVDLLAPIQRQRRAAESYNGCYSTSSGFTEAGTDPFMSTGVCVTKCGTQAVMALTNGNDCFCGNSLPPASAKVDDSKCNIGCFGYGTVDCGGSGFWSVWLTGSGSVSPQQAGGSSSAASSSAGASSSPPASSTASPAETTPTADPATTPAPATSPEALQTIVTSVAPGTTVVVTQAATPTAISSSASPSSESKSSGGSNTAGIAAGVVVGVVAAAAIAGGMFFLLRRRRQAQAEEDYKNRTAGQGNAMRQEQKPPGTSYSQASDQRLDPSFGRRNSVGSMADSQDYSRRILRVANPDGN